MLTLERFVTAGPRLLIVVALIYAVPRTVHALAALFRVPSEKQPAAHRALAELYNMRRGR